MENRYEIIMKEDYAKVYDKLVENWYTIDYSFYGIKSKEDIIEVMKKYFN